MSGAVVVTGAGGLLGRAMVDALGGRAAGFDRVALDITDPDAVAAAVRGAAAVVNAAAFADVDACESEPDRAYAVNAAGPENLARACAATGAFLIHVSTDFVFDGTLGRAYVETDEPSPLSVYSASKLEGEQRVAQANPQAAIVRTAWVYGPGGRTFFSKVFSMAAAGGPIPATADQFGSPTWVGDLAAALSQLAVRPAAGLFHVAGGGSCSPAEFVEAALGELGLAGVAVTRVRAADLPARPARRPLATPLEGPAWIAAGFEPLRPWREALEDAAKVMRP
ncbi:MAG TPA: dTDP-4-dehydrorhamnose reductase [Actinomycetota bacterium]|nr:dTDP-4-dehydrorhamnose reductase [Actinomycetota bacterium]